MKTNLNSNYLTFQPHFEIEKTKLATFLKSYESLDIGKDKIYGRHKYMIEIQKIANREIKTIEILKYKKIYFTFFRCYRRNYAKSNKTNYFRR